MVSRRPKILCVDDEVINLELLEALLVPNGYEVIKAANGEEALKKIKNFSIDLVLLDILMPGMDGFEVCRRIKNDRRYSHIPVVMITGLQSIEDRIEAIKAGAEDFISKPFDFGEVSARIKMLLKVKDLNDKLRYAYQSIVDLTSYGEVIMEGFAPLRFEFISGLDAIVKQIIRKDVKNLEKPESVIIGFQGKEGKWQCYKYQFAAGTLERQRLDSKLRHFIAIEGQQSKIVFYNEEEFTEEQGYTLLKELKDHDINPLNLVGYLSPQLCVLAINYGKEVSHYDAAVLQSIVMQTMFLKSLADQIKETQSAFNYTVYALARAAEANDEDTGNHILRVGEYAAVIAQKLGFDDKFINIIKNQAALHDVGKVYVHPDILRKPKELDQEEWEIIKKHPFYGARIIGTHPRLRAGYNIALTHHERWDGTGYPKGLMKDKIPIEGRIMAIADVYDALRNSRPYKPAFDHETASKIILEGDERTMPSHFDPQVLKTFRENAGYFEEIYEKLA